MRWWGDRERCLSVGMNDYLSKPFTQAELLSVLQPWLPAKAERGDVAGEDAADGGAQSLASSSGQREPVAFLDVAVLEQLRELERRGRVNALGRIIDAYLEQSRNLIDQLREAITSGEAPGIQFAAHTLKSSSANVGASKLSALCKGLEDLGRNEITKGAAEGFSEVEAMHRKVCEALIQERQREVA